MAISAGAYLYNTSPYNIWLISKVNSAVGQTTCLPGWDMKNLASAFKKTEKKHIEKILYAGKLLSLEVGAHLYGNEGSLDGGGGRDTLGWGGGDLLIGDHRIISFETISSLAEKPFKVVVLMTGFASAQDNTIEFNDNSKTRFDVYLDGCLNWSFPKRLRGPIEKDEPSYDWEISALDPLGNKATVRITKKVTLHYIPRKPVIAWSRAVNNYSAK